MKMFRKLIAFLSLLAPSICIPHDQKQQHAVIEVADVALVDTFLANMKKRLLLMHDIAAWKWKHNAPIDNPIEEAEEREVFLSICQDSKIDNAAFKTFIQRQIEAGKLVQMDDFHNWVLQDMSVGPIDPKADKSTLMHSLFEVDRALAQNFITLQTFPHEMKGLIEYRANGVFEGTDLSAETQATALPF